MAKPYSGICVGEWSGRSRAGPPSRKLRSNVAFASAPSSASLKLHRETGSVDPAKFGGYKDFALAAHEDLVRQLVAEQPDITLAELGDRLRKKKITVGKSSISRFLHHLKLPF
jgi:hypothetical protein